MSTEYTGTQANNLRDVNLAKTSADPTTTGTSADPTGASSFRDVNLAKSSAEQTYVDPTGASNFRDVNLAKSSVDPPEASSFRDVNLAKSSATTGASSFRDVNLAKSSEPRTINFRDVNLAKKTTLLLTFNDEQTIPGIYDTISPTAFKVLTFEGSGTQQFQFNPQLVVAAAKIQGCRVVAETFTQINPGEQTTLTNVFSKPEAIVPATQAIKAINGTNESQNIGLAVFNDPDRQPIQTLVFRDVKPGSNVLIKFIPILKGYIVSDQQQEGNILNTPIQEEPVFQENLATLAETTNWTVTLNPASGQIQIQPE